MQNISTPSQRRTAGTDNFFSTKCTTRIRITRIHTWPFSAISPYLITCPPYSTLAVPDREIYRQESDGYNRRYLRSSTYESQPNNISLLIRKELETIFYEETASYLRKEQSFRLGWRRDGTMPTFNQLQFTEEAFTQNRGLEDLKEYLNKEIMIYFQCGSLVGRRQDDKLGRYFYREWLRLHNGRPPFQRHSFFAKPVCFGEKGPQSIQQIGVFHKALCDAISARLDDDVDFFPMRPQSPTGTTDAPPLFNPIPSRTIQSWRDHGFILKHIFRSLYIVIDDQTSAGDQELPTYRARRPHDDLALYLEECCDWSLAQYTVLLVKTGDEAKLHSPISFLPLFEAGLALEVNRGDYTGAPEEDVVRVKVDVAVRFIWDVLYKEQKALGEVGQAAQALIKEQQELCEVWTENVMDHAQMVGFEENGYTWLAARRARARLNGEAFDEDQVKPSWEHLRHWDC
ncbi:hypothetical protein B0T10DRAFT_588840 [Thelonectria olida]|uniref:Uncharacterized protein n=1 Tax=Thelonectria olida TaxID=1576542 RepID=A0A9P8VU91_9HYPO|nr:hypothetical protein B0T10DRAFT_588840 [Thelonectria olida]